MNNRRMTWLPEPTSLSLETCTVRSVERSTTMPQTKTTAKMPTTKHHPRKTNRHSAKTQNKSATETAIVPAKPEKLDYIRQEALRGPSIQEYADRHKEIRHFIRKSLKSGTDYDQIPGTNGKALLQPGAEKIAVWLKVRPYFEKTEIDMGHGHFEVVSRCHLLPYMVYTLIQDLLASNPSNVKEAVEAIIRASELSNAEASCSTMETNFRYRWADMRDENGKPLNTLEGFDRKAAAKLSAISMGRYIPAKMDKGKIVAMSPKEKRARVPVEYWIWQER